MIRGVSRPYKGALSDSVIRFFHKKLQLSFFSKTVDLHLICDLIFSYFFHIFAQTARPGGWQTSRHTYSSDFCTPKSPGTGLKIG